MPQVVSDMLIASKSSPPDEEALYRDAVAVVVNALLDPATAASSLYDAGLSRIEPLDPERVGGIYQRLRSLRLDRRKTGRPVLAACIQTRRNQGLFYTPEPIVRHIVARTLDALNLSDSLDFLSVRIVDPAVGTGVFLAEALDQLTHRALNPQKGNPLLPEYIEEIRNRFGEKLQGHALTRFPDKETAVRLHLIENCLYGVDLDPIAVAVARAVLLKRAFRSLPAANGIEPNLRVGNALIGQGRGDPSIMSRDAEDLKHTAACLPPKLHDPDLLAKWRRDSGMFHWPLEFPEVFAAGSGGFDAVVGNPPYEIVSVKESGIRSRRHEQRYYRCAYGACKGKINTYRLMMERGLIILKEGGVLGFIVPATLLADSTAEPLRREILDRSEVLDAVVIPEKARVFEGVTQALLILVTRKGGRTRSVSLSFRDGSEPIHAGRGAEMSRDLIEKTGLRIALIRSEEEKLILQALLRHPPLGGNELVPPVGRVHQGEINLTIHRKFITNERTDHPLVRGEHVAPWAVVHPTRKGDRLDWVKPEFFEAIAGAEPVRRVAGRDLRRFRGIPWERERIVLGRVVNMATGRRLKAAAVPAGTLLGDMTNYIANATIPTDYLMGLLNSSLLNWRVKLTSTNNYLSAAEIEALPIPRLLQEKPSPEQDRRAKAKLDALLDRTYDSPVECLSRLREEWSSLPAGDVPVVAATVIRRLVQAVRRVPSGPGPQDRSRSALWDVLDAVVLLLYGVEKFEGLDNL